MKLTRVVTASAEMAATRSRKRKTAELVELQDRLYANGRDGDGTSVPAAGTHSADAPGGAVHDDDLVGGGEPRAGGEDRSRVAHRDAVAEEVADAGDGRREVDGAEDDEPRWRRDRCAHARLTTTDAGTVRPEA